MYRLARIAHLIGLTLFLGSIFGHIVASALGGAPGSPELVFAREEIVAATRALTLPGLGLAVASGLVLARLGGRSPSRDRWLAAKAALTALIVLNAVAFIAPLGANLLREAGSAAADAAAAARYLAGRPWEDALGAANVAMTLMVVALGVFKPSLSKRAGRA